MHALECIFVSRNGAVQAKGTRRHVGCERAGRNDNLRSYRHRLVLQALAIFKCRINAMHKQHE